jgi:hypothetical protein
LSGAVINFETEHPDWSLPMGGAKA